MPTLVTTSAISVPISDTTEPRNWLAEEILRAISKNNSIPGACLRALGKSPAEVNPVDYFEYARDHHIEGLPRAYISRYNATYFNYDPTRFGKYPITDKYNFFPFNAIRLNNKSIKSTDGRVYTDTKQLFKIGNTDLSSLITALESNPKSDDINDAFVSYDIPITSDDPAYIKYLHAFFKNLLEDLSGDYLTNVANIYRSNHPMPTYPSHLPEPPDWDEIIYNWIQTEWLPNPCSLRDYYLRSSELSFINIIQGEEFKVSLGLAYIWVSLEEGVIGKIGDVIKEENILPLVEEKIVEGGANSSTPNVFYVYLNESEIIFKKQVSATQIEVVKVVGAQHYTHIHNRGLVEPITLNTIAEDPSLKENFYIPIDFNTLIDNQTSEDLKSFGLSRTLHINTIQYTSLKWYETEIFKDLMFGISLATALISFQPWIAAAAVSGTAFVTAILELVITSIVIEKIANFVIDNLGLEFAFLLSVATAVLGLGSDLVNRFTDLLPDNLLKNVSSVSSKVSSALIEGIDSYAQDLLEDLKDEYSNFIEEDEKRQDELNSAKALLSSSSISNPFNFIGDPYFDPNESPEDFYFRTISGASNVDNFYKVIENYANLALTLPEPNKEIGIS